MPTQTYPANLSYAISKMTGFSKQTVKLVPSKDSSISPGETITIDLPSNALVDLATLQLHTTVTTTATGTTNVAAMPSKHSENMIAKIAVSVNGVQLMSSGDLPLIQTMLLNLNAGTDCTGRRTPYSLGADLGASGDSGNASVTSKAVVVSNWAGFLGSVQPRVLDTALTGSIRVDITFSGEGIMCVKNHSDNTGSISIDTAHATVDVLGINDDAYYKSTQSFLQAGNTLELPFQTWISTLNSVSSTSQTTRFSVNTGSLDMVLACFPENYTVNTVGLANDTMHQANTLKMTSGGDVDTYQFSVNNITYPAYAPGASEAFPLLMSAFRVNNDLLGGCDPNITTDAIYKSDSFICGYKFNAEGVDISGISTLGSSAQIAFQTVATSGSSKDPGYCFLAALCSSVLRISAGQSISVIY